MANSLRWWQEGAIYQLVVPSFLDTNGDGVGDLPGVTSRLDYLDWLGVRALWLSPIYPSPMVDLGYDIADLVDVDPRFGTLSDFDELLSESHRRDLRVILDWVPNHTSDEHPWFVESRSSRDNARRNWYFWRDPKPDGSPPNNWISVFGGSSWHFDERTGQYYLHTFSHKQPDLNWRQPEVRSAMFDTLRFWLARGVDGFRVDAMDRLMKDEQFRDNPPNPDYSEQQLPIDQLEPKYTRGQPGIHDALALVRAVMDEYGDDRLLAGELYSPTKEMMQYHGKERPELHLPFNLRLSWTTWKADELKSAIDDYQQKLDSHWPTWTLSTHDSKRVAMRCAGAQTRVGAMLLLTLPGTPTHYYGEEVGMRGVEIPPQKAIDPQGRGTGKNRDPVRTPMQWSPDRHAGFASVEPWLRIGEDFATANVASQQEDPQSLLTLYRRLLALRGEETALLGGQHEWLPAVPPLMAYRRTDDGRQLLVLLNLGDAPQTYQLNKPTAARVLLSTYLDRSGEATEGQVRLRGDEGLLLVVHEPPPA